jgi:hypothetical protein
MDLDVLKISPSEDAGDEHVTQKSGRYDVDEIVCGVDGGKTN